MLRNIRNNVNLIYRCGYAQFLFAEEEFRTKCVKDVIQLIVQSAKKNSILLMHVRIREKHQTHKMKVKEY